MDNNHLINMKITVVVPNDDGYVQLVDENGKGQKAFVTDGSPYTILEAKDVNGEKLLRIGGDTEWLPAKYTSLEQKVNTQAEFVLPDFHGKSSSSNDSKQNEPAHKSAPSKDADNTRDASMYHVVAKNGLALEQGSPVPDESKLSDLIQNANLLPKGTKYSWKYAPDTDQSKETDAQIQVTFPDGSISEVNVKYSIIPSQKQDKPELHKQNKAAFPSRNPHPNLKKTNRQTPQNNFPNLDLGGLNFNFIDYSDVVANIRQNKDEALNLFAQKYYRPMSNTLRQGLEIFANDLLKNNKINPGPKWENANLSDKLSYIAVTRLLPKTIMDLAFDIKDYGNIGSHYNKSEFTTVSALNDLQKYHDLLVYFVNTYDSNKELPYADVQITNEVHQKPRWYQRPHLKEVISFEQFLRNKYKKPTPRPVPKPEPKVKKKNINWYALVIGILLVAIGFIGFRLYQQKVSNQAGNVSNPTQSSTPTAPIKQQAAALNEKQVTALCLVYAKNKLGSEWEKVYKNLQSNDFQITRYKHYTFGDADVTVQGNNYIYVLSQNVGFGSQQRNTGLMVTFFDPSQDDPVANPERAYTYKMLDYVKKNGHFKEVQSLANRINYTDSDND